jgi:hypothetical protein
LIYSRSLATDTTTHLKKEAGASLDGVKDGAMAMAVYAEAVNPSTDQNRRDQICQQLLAYCRLDTFAMVRLWQVLSGRNVDQQG